MLGMTLHCLIVKLRGLLEPEATNLESPNAPEHPSERPRPSNFIRLDSGHQVRMVGNRIVGMFGDICPVASRYQTCGTESHSAVSYSVHLAPRWIIILS